ncbi:hypothetical protein HDV05_002897 [Chytridiales sp. JEL 0842]|nr:hypothetical protein HDV05_002897 [Chytridiales sp. JEL 0842]
MHLNFLTSLASLILLASTTTASPLPATTNQLPSCAHRSSVPLHSQTGLENNSPCALAPQTVGFRSFYPRDGQIYDANDNLFVMRGINHPFSWYRFRSNTAFKDIKSTNSNALRIVLQTTDDASAVAEAIRLARENKLVAIVENHDGTGYGEKGGSKSLSEIVDWWIRVKSAMDGTEEYVILNIANEPIGNNNFLQWTDATKNAILKLRKAGFRHMLMIDGPNWGQDWSFTMRDNAVSVFETDPDRNLVFSVHMYGVYNTPAKVTSYIDSYTSRNLPIVVGEFGFDHSDGNPDEETIFSYSESQNLGWLAWSWSGNSGGVEYLDLVNGFDVTRPTAWGRQTFANLKSAKEASIFGNGGGPQPPSTSTAVPPRPTTTRPPSTTTTSAPQPTTPPGKEQIILHAGPNSQQAALTDLQCNNNILQGSLHLSLTFSYPFSSNPSVLYPPLSALGLPTVRVSFFNKRGEKVNVSVNNSWNSVESKGEGNVWSFKLVQYGQTPGFYGSFGSCSGSGKVEVGEVKVSIESGDVVDAQGLPNGFNGLPGVGRYVGAVRVENELPEVIRA